MFGKLKQMLGQEKNGITVSAPIAGEAVSVAQVNDPTFSNELLGKGIAIKPSSNRVVSPVNGTVSQMFETGHAVILTSNEGVEVLVHVGLDTVKLKGKFYTIHAHTGDQVQAGDLLMEFDKDGIVNAGYDVITPVVICNSDDFKSIDISTGLEVKEGDKILSLVK